MTKKSTKAEAPDRGRFLATTWRMHPDVCRFISEVAYENRLESAPECSRQGVGGDGDLGGTGLRYRPVIHAGNRTSSPEEAAVVAELFGDLLGRPWTDRNGHRRELTIEDILIVAPYNAHVALLAAFADRNSVAHGPWCGDSACEMEIKDATHGVTIRVVTEEPVPSGAGRDGSRPRGPGRRPRCSRG